jgi:hypothetical protein
VITVLGGRPGEDGLLTVVGGLEIALSRSADPRPEETVTVRTCGSAASRPFRGPTRTVANETRTETAQDGLPMTPVAIIARVTMPR